MTDPMVDTTGAGATATTSAGSTLGKQIGTESALSNYVGPYVTEMLGRGQALGSMPYQAYQGPLTAGQSDLQSQAFSGSILTPSGAAFIFVPTLVKEDACPVVRP